MPDETKAEQKGGGEGAWIFLSHSNKDFEKVCEVRNELERRGHKPLMFFLKCLESGDARLPELLREEIAARHWFVLCDSPNAQASDYVQEEIAMIRSMEGKVFEKIDLSKGLETELHKLIELSNRATVFLSYARQDREIAERIRHELLLHDYSVWFDASLGSGEDWASTLDLAIDDAVARGFVLVLLSPASLTSEWCKHETEYALELAAKSERSNVIPVVVAPFASAALPPQLVGLQWFDLTEGRFEERLEELIHNLKVREME